MCGIISCLTINNNLVEILINGLKQLQNRGYDSAGLSFFKNDTLNTYKFASNEIDSIEKLENKTKKIKDINIGIAHTRWATHGPKTDYNSHPHVSCNNNIALVHNGIIENFQSLKKFLLNNNFKFKSDTDTEVIVNLLEYHSYNDSNFFNVIKKTINMLEGTYGLAIINLKENNKIYCVRHGSPLLIGQDDNNVIITSEQSGFNGLVNNYFILDSDDICEISIDLNLDSEPEPEPELGYTYNKNERFSIKTRKKYEILNTNLINFDLSPFPYDHWTIKEINEQFDASLRAISFGGRLLDDNKVKLGGLNENIEILKRIDNLLFLGCGTSLNACNYGLSHFRDLCNFNIINVHDGAEFDISYIPKIGNTALVLLSQSGETADLFKCLKIGRDNDLFVMSLINVVDSLIARESNCGCYLNAGREVGVASTKSFVNQCILLSMLAIWFSQIHDKNNIKRKKYIEDLRKLPYDIKKTIKISEENVDLFLKLLNKDKMFILGKGQGESIAKEGALKIKEITYIFTEGYSSSALKHGPFALLDKNVPVVIISPNNSNYSKNCNAYEEIKSRKSPILFITDENKCTYENKVIIPKNNTYGNLLCIIPIQLAAYHLSIHKNLNPDKPRNLAKCVTVE